MNVWANTEFTGHYPVGTASIVVAETQDQAAALLNAALVERGLKETARPEQFSRIATNTPVAVVLNDGDY